MDYGYPQILSIDVLRTYINLGTIRSLDGDPQESGQLTSQITGAIDWRREGIRHRKNEVRPDEFDLILVCRPLQDALGAQVRVVRMCLV